MIEIYQPVSFSHEVLRCGRLFGAAVWPCTLKRWTSKPEIVDSIPAKLRQTVPSPPVLGMEVKKIPTNDNPGC